MNIHEEQVLASGQELEEAEKAVLMIHGRGATAQSILQLHRQLPEAAYLAPQAAKRTWYPNSFMEPKEKNQPHLDSALDKIDQLVEKVSEFVPKEKIVLLGFSQGACLATEYAAQNSRQYGGVVAFSGGLIGDELGNYDGQMKDTPIFLGCAEKDPHIPLERVNKTEKILVELGAEVEKHIFEGSHHGITDYGIERARKIISAL